VRIGALSRFRFDEAADLYVAVRVRLVMHRDRDAAVAIEVSCLGSAFCGIENDRVAIDVDPRLASPAANRP
jgi:hypothetical protein